MLNIIRDGNRFWATARNGDALCVYLSGSGKHIAIIDTDCDEIFLTLEEADALLSILPEAIADLKQNSA